MQTQQMSTERQRVDNFGKLERLNHAAAGRAAEARTV